MQVVTVSNEFDWQGLRRKIILYANGGRLNNGFTVRCKHTLDTRNGVIPAASLLHFVLQGE